METVHRREPVLKNTIFITIVSIEMFDFFKFFYSDFEHYRIFVCRGTAYREADCDGGLDIHIC